jgi:hypothetical protein
MSASLYRYVMNHRILPTKKNRWNVEASKLSVQTSVMARRPMSCRQNTMNVRRACQAVSQGDVQTS